MIFGKLTDQQPAHSAWHKQFAWRPVRLTDGRWAWLQYVEWSCNQAPEVCVDVGCYPKYRPWVNPLDRRIERPGCSADNW